MLENVVKDAYSISFPEQIKLSAGTTKKRHFCLPKFSLCTIGSAWLNVNKTQTPKENFRIKVDHFPTSDLCNRRGMGKLLLISWLLKFSIVQAINVSFLSYACVCNNKPTPSNSYNWWQVKGTAVEDEEGVTPEGSFLSLFLPSNFTLSTHLDFAQNKLFNCYKTEWGFYYVKYINNTVLL